MIDPTGATAAGATPGRARLAIRPVSTGAADATITIGMLLVARFRNAVASEVAVTSTSGFCCISSAASVPGVP